MTNDFLDIFDVWFNFAHSYILWIMALVMFMALAIMFYEWFRFKE